MRRIVFAVDRAGRSAEELRSPCFTLRLFCSTSLEAVLLPGMVHVARGRVWLSIAACGCLWLLWLLVAACGWLRLPVAVCGCRWLPVAACGCLWLPVAACGCLWLPLVACGCLWVSVAACGCLWLLVAACSCLKLRGLSPPKAFDVSKLYF